MEKSSSRLLTGNRGLNYTLQSSLDFFRHPVAAASALLLLANVFILQRYFPSWFSGKIGDLAWMVLAPALISLIVDRIFPQYSCNQQKASGLFSMFITAAAFALLKTNPVANSAAGSLFTSLTGLQLKLTLDPGDLIVLPGLAIFYFIWMRNLNRINRPLEAVETRSGKTPRGNRIKTGFYLGLVMFAAAADMPAPAELGITCLVEKDAQLYAFNTMLYGKNQEILWAAYNSSDGGLTWSHAGSKTSAKSTPTAEENKVVQVFGSCQLKKKTYEAVDPGNAAIHYVFAPGTAVYRSDDGGETMRKEMSLVDKTVEDSIWHSTTGNLVLALGKTGIAVRGKDGKWVEIPIKVFKTVNLY